MAGFHWSAQSYINIIGIWTTGVSNERKKTYLVSLDSTCTQSKMQADAILVRSDRCIVSRANGKFKGNILIECSLRYLGACCRATYVCRVSEEDSCGWNNDPKVQQIWKSNFSSLLTDRQPREWHFKGSCWLLHLRRVLHQRSFISQVIWPLLARIWMSEFAFPWWQTGNGTPN